MSVSTCRHCDQTIALVFHEDVPLWTWIHTRTGETKCPIRYATPVESVE